MPLQLTTGSVSIPARLGVLPGVETFIMASEDLAGAAHRLIEVGSPTSQPFNLWVSWTVAGGTSPSARVSVASGARICIYARSVELRASNMDDQVSTLIWSVSDGHIPTSNTYQVEYEGAVVNAALQVASFANRVRLEPSDPAAVGTLEFLNGNGVVVATWPWGSIPSAGVPIGATDVLRVDCSSACRVVYDLAF